MAWNEILDSFKQEFKTTGPERYSNIDNPHLRYELAGKRKESSMQGMNTSVGMIGKHRDMDDERAKAERSAAEAKKQNYRREYNKSGGFDFYDGEGKKVTPWEFALAKQMPIDKVLEGSYDSGDRQFIEDYRAMQMDIDSGMVDMPTAMQKISEDYANIFYGGRAAELGLDRTPTPGRSYKPFRESVGRERIEGFSFAAENEGRSLGLDKKQVRVFDGAATNIKTTDSPREAMKSLQSVYDSKEFKRLDEMDQETISQTLEFMIYSLFPDTLYNDSL